MHRFCDSGHISLDSKAHGALIAHLRMSLTEKNCGEVLCLNLEHALSMRATPEIHRVFEETFQIIVSGPNRHVVIESVKKEATRLLSSFINNNNYNIEDFAWLYGLLWSVHVTQSIVDFLLKEGDLFLSMCNTQSTNKVWIKLIGGMLQDVLDVCLFLTSLERYTLFTSWHKMCENNFYKDHDLRELFIASLMTFPFQEQMEMMESWNGMDEHYKRWGFFK